MGWLPRDPNATAGASAATYPIARWYALTVLAALLLLVVLRHLFGSVRIEGGVH